MSSKTNDEYYKYSPFEFNKLYEFRLNSEYTDLPKATIQRITKCVTADYIMQGKYLQKPFPYHSFSAEIEWRWMATRGALTKRIAKWLKDNADTTLLDTTKTAIGTVVRDSITKNQDYYFDVTTDLQWQAGNFADGNSCFYTTADRKGIPKAMMAENRFAAVRFFKRYNNALLKRKTDEPNNIYYADDNYYYQGISRAYICFDAYRLNNVKMYKMFDLYQNIPLMVVFNGYGFSTKLIASILSSFTGLQTKRISITNNQKVTGGLYVNDGGFLLGDTEAIKLIKSYDFGVKWGSEDKIVEERVHQDIIEPLRDAGRHRDAEIEQLQKAPYIVYEKLYKRLRQENPTVEEQALEKVGVAKEVEEEPKKPAPRAIGDEFDEFDVIWREIEDGARRAAQGRFHIVGRAQHNNFEQFVQPLEAVAAN